MRQYQKWIEDWKRMSPQEKHHAIGYGIGMFVAGMMSAIIPILIEHLLGAR
jgi:hypothetical protein